MSETTTKAKGYRAKRDVSFSKPVAQISENNWSSEGVNYPAGSLIPADHLMPFVREQAENGKLGHLIEPISNDEFEAARDYEQAGEPSFAIFAAEHEAEAHALREAGHHVIPKDQVLESLSAGAEHAARYQQAVKEAGLDRRAPQEHMARAETEEGRIPDHLLHGMETRTGLPHNRGLTAREREEGPAEEESDSGNGADSENPSAARPRPGDGLHAEQADQKESDGDSQGSSGSDQANQGSGE